jgi:hypothetical protein
VFQAGSEWPSSGYKQIERGLLLDFGFNSTPLVKCLLFLLILIEKVDLHVFMSMVIFMKSVLLRDVSHCHTIDCGPEAVQTLMRKEYSFHIGFCGFVQRYMKKT